MVTAEASLRRQLEQTALNSLHYNRRLLIILEENFIPSQPDETSELTMPLQCLNSGISTGDFTVFTLCRSSYRQNLNHQMFNQLARGSKILFTILGLISEKRRFQSQNENLGRRWRQ